MSTITWPQAVEISDIPGVHEALQTFSEDATEDNAVCVILAVAKALATPAQAQQAWGYIDEMGCAIKFKDAQHRKSLANAIEYGGLKYLYETSDKKGT